MLVPGTQKRQCLIYLVIDTSGSMDGTKISQVNYSIPQVLSSIQDLNDSNPEAEIEVALLAFDSHARWVTKNPEKPEDLKKHWKDLTANGLTELGEACNFLNEKMHRTKNGGFHDDSAGALTAGVIFITDGLPTGSYKPALAKLQKNHWYKDAFKYCLACGDDLSEGMSVFEELVGNNECIHLISDENACRLGDYIRVVTAIVSDSVSSTIPLGETNKEDNNQGTFNQDAVDQINEEVKSIDDLIHD